MRFFLFDKKDDQQHANKSLKCCDEHKGVKGELAQNERASAASATILKVKDRRRSNQWTYDCAERVEGTLEAESLAATLIIDRIGDERIARRSPDPLACAI